MSHEEAGGLVLLAALFLLILWVGAARWQGGGPPRGMTAQTIGITPSPEFRPPSLALDAPPEPWTPATAMQTAGSPCRAPACPALRYAPLDEHLVTAHHAHDNQKRGTQ